MSKNLKSLNSLNNEFFPDIINYLGKYSTRFIEVEVNNYFDLFPEFFANLTASFSTSFNALDVLAVMNGNLASMPSPLDCVANDLQNVVVQATEARRKLLKILSETIPSKFGEFLRILVQIFYFFNLNFWMLIFLP